MPTYDYVCQDCSRPFEIRASISEYSAGLSAQCRTCGSENTVRKFTAVNVLTGSRGAAGSPGISAGCGPGAFT